MNKLLTLALVVLFPMLSLGGPLAIGTTNGFGFGTKLLNPVETNSAFHGNWTIMPGQGVKYLRVTNVADYLKMMVFEGDGTNEYNFQFGDTGPLGQIYFNGQHSGGPEMIFTADAFGFAMGAYSGVGSYKNNRRMQLGVGELHHGLVTMQDDERADATTTLGYSNPFQFTCSYYSNALFMVYPTIMARAKGSNQWSIDFFTNFSDTITANNWASIGQTPVVSINCGATSGLDVRGALTTLNSDVNFGTSAQVSYTGGNAFIVGNGAVCDLWVVNASTAAASRYMRVGQFGNYFNLGGLLVGAAASATLATFQVTGTAFISNNVAPIAAFTGDVYGSHSGSTNFGASASMHKTASDTLNFITIQTVTNYAFSSLRGFTGSLEQGTLTNTAAGNYELSAQMEITDTSGSRHTMGIYTNTVLAGRTSAPLSALNADATPILLPQVFFLPAGCRIELKETTDAPSVARNFDRATLNVDAW